MCASFGAFAEGLSTEKIPDSFTETIELDERVYVPSSTNDLTWAVANRSALRVKEGKRAILYLPNPGQTITVNGADAYEQKMLSPIVMRLAMHGAYPAIEVPSNSTLIVCGVGTLVCNGGNALPGEKGGWGQDGVICTDATKNHGYAGFAGAGGWGGGGGAPGIGGVGGVGGVGGQAGSANASWVGKCWARGTESQWTHVGPPGGAGTRGGDGTASGKVYAFEPLVLKVVGGAAGKGGDGGDQHWVNGEGWDDENASVDDDAGDDPDDISWAVASCTNRSSRGYWCKMSDFWCVGGSGSGGGGGGGSAPRFGIGGGGAGGGGGGGGGCCGMTHFDDMDEGEEKFKSEMNNRGPSGGMGGGGLSRNQTNGRGVGLCYSNISYIEPDGRHREGGAGGVGGDYGDYGNDGGFSVVSGVGYDRDTHIDLKPGYMSYLTGLTLDTELKFSVTLLAGQYGTFKDTGTNESTREFTFGTYKRGTNIGIPTRVGYTFMGFYDQPNEDNEKEPKGLMFVDEGGYPCRPWLYPENGKKLYALWSGEGPILTVTNPGASGAHTFFETLQTLKTTREPGKKILFDLALGSNTVKLPQGTPLDFNSGFQTGETVTIDGFNGGRGVTIRGDGSCSAFSCQGIALQVFNLTFAGCGLAEGDPLHPNDTGAISGRALTGLVVDGCRFTECRSRAGGAAIDAALVDGASVSIAYTTFESCQAEGDGGAVNLASAAGSVSLSVDNCRFAGCSAGGRGGAFAAGKLFGMRMFNTTIYGCASGGEGAALLLTGATSASVIEMVNVSVCDCATEKALSGAIHVFPGHLVMANASVLRNRVSHDGAQIELGDDSLATVVNTGVQSASSVSFWGGTVKSYVSVIYKDPSLVDEVYGTRISSRTVGGVVQSGYLPLVDSLAAGNGTDVWYNPKGLDLVILDPATSDKVTLVGDAAKATERLTKDLFGRDYGGEGLRPEIGAIWGGEVCVTSNLDDDGPNTLRTAMGGLRNGYIVTFDLPDGNTEIVLREEIALAGERMSVGFTVDGENNGRGVTVSGGGATRLFSVGDGQILTLENLTLNAGSTSGNGGLAAVAAGGRFNATNCRFSKGAAAGGGGAAWVEGDAFFDSCSFDGNTASNGGAAGCETGGSVAFVNCTLEGNKAETRGGGIYSRGTAVVANSTMVDNVGMGTAIASYGGQGAAVNSIFVSDVDTVDADILAETTTYSLYHVLVGVNDGAVGDEIATGSKSRIFLTDHSQGYTRRGVAQLVWRLKQGGSACEKGVTVFRDAECRNVACLLAQTVDRQAFDKTAVWGDAAAATDIVSSDITAFTFSAAPSYGSYQARIDEPTLAVTSSDDITDDKDGFVTLREAVAFAKAYPGLKDPTDGMYHIDILTTDNQGRPAVTLAQNGVILEGLGAPVVIRGAGNAPCSVSGNGEYRALYVSAGQSLRVENLTFTNCFAQVYGIPNKSHGGAILNAGRLDVENCRFSDCNGDPYRTTDGGAVCTLGGATTTVSRCTFTDCTATYGGAVANLDGGVTVATACTFRGNTAKGSGGGVMPSGGALYGEAKSSASRLLAANCTFVDNTVPMGMGGAVAAVGGAKATYAAVALANSILVGNPAKYAAFNGGGPGADLYSDGSKVRLAFVRYGGRNAQGDGVYFETETQSATAADLFATVTADGAPVASTAAFAGVEQVFYPVLEAVTSAGGYVRHDAAWENVAVYSTAEGTSGGATLFGSERTARRGENLKAEICGGCEEPTQTIGSTSLTEEPDVPRKPDGEEDPLVVKEFTEEALRTAISMAAADPSLAKDGKLVVSIEGPGMIQLTKPLTVDGFSELPLVIRGPVTLSGDGATGLIELRDGNGLMLENLTLANGSAEAGGAVYAGAGTRLTAVNCQFFQCDAEDGGAVCFDCFDCAAFFQSCSFTDCQAEFTGGAVYQAGGFPLTFLNCTFAGNTAGEEGDDVYVPLRAAVEKPDGTVGVFGTVAEACLYAARGDTLAILSADADDPTNYEAAEKRGVKIEIRTGGIDPADLMLGKALKAVRFGSVSFSGEPAARPKLLKAAVGGTDAVSATLTGVTRGLWYGLGRSATVDGEYVVENWVWAESDGDITVKAPRTGPTGFYRIKVSTKGE